MDLEKRIKTVVRDRGRNVTYELLAHRRLSRAEAELLVRQFVRTKEGKRASQPNSIVTTTVEVD